MDTINNQLIQVSLKAESFEAEALQSLSLVSAVQESELDPDQKIKAIYVIVSKYQSSVNSKLLRLLFPPLED